MVIDRLPLVEENVYDVVFQEQSRRRFAAFLSKIKKSKTIKSFTTQSSVRKNSASAPDVRPPVFTDVRSIRPTKIRSRASCQAEVAEEERVIAGTQDRGRTTVDGLPGDAFRAAGRFPRPSDRPDDKSRGSR